MQGRMATAPVGASMAVLATLQDAGVLPPEGTAEANRAIQTVIQFQAVFMKSSDPAVDEFRSQALAHRWAAQAEEIGTVFRRNGWTSEVLEAFVDRYAELRADQRANLAAAFAQFNMRQNDFELLSTLYDQARSRFREQGRDIHEIFAAHRRTMPGGPRPNRKEQRHGDQSLHSYQGQGGTHQRGLASA
jgi:hypothetical protein